MDVNEKKIVLKSPSGSSIKPGDVTQEVAAIPAPSGPPLSDPLNMRETDTGKLKKIGSDQPAQPAVSDTSAQARRTIKLRPVAATGSGVAVTPSAPPMGQAPASAADADATVQMMRPTVMQTPPVTQSAAVPPPAAKQTIRLRPSTPAPSAAPSATDTAAISEQQTIAIPRPSTSPTLKLKPMEQQPGTAPSGEAPAAGPKPIKLTVREPAAAPSAPTMQMPEPQDAFPQAASAPPSAPTMQVDQPMAETKPASGKMTLKLKKTEDSAPSMPPAVEAAMREQAAEAEHEEAAHQSAAAEPPLFAVAAALAAIVIGVYCYVEYTSMPILAIVGGN